VIDGEAVLLGVDGTSNFDGLHSRKYNDEVQLYAFDAMMLDGGCSLDVRTGSSSRPLNRARSVRSCFAKPASLEGLVSKHRDRQYRAGPSPNWVKVKNPKHPAMTRVKEAFK
jgi:bifunctional non-homologous end joining protein LigD